MEPFSCSSACGDYARVAERSIEVFGGFAIPLPRSLLEVKGGSRYVTGKQVEPACAITTENGHVCAEVVPSFEVNGLFGLLWIKSR